MLTDAPPRDGNRAGFLKSDQIKTLDLPQDGRLPEIAKSIESAMQAGKIADARRACTEFVAQASAFYRTPVCGVRVLAARPLRVREYWTTELFGDYDPGTMLLRLWMRTAIRKELTSFGTFLSTLCHEFCHSLDFQLFKFRGTHVGSTSVPQLFTIMRGARRANGFSGLQFRADATALTGNGLIRERERSVIVNPDIRGWDRTKRNQQFGRRGRIHGLGMP